MKEKFNYQHLLAGRIVFSIIAILFISLTVQSQENEKDEDKTLSPYFFVKSDNPPIDQLPLASTSVEVDVAGVIANVNVKQVYKNEGNRAIEAVYVFPGSTRAAVYAMTMTIGERVIVAQIKEKEQARQEYEIAKQQGKSASLLEQERPNVFTMNVANIMPGDVIEIDMKYTELLVPDAGVYQFVYPTVVGPRYSNETVEENPNDKWVASPYTPSGEKPLSTFDIKVNIKAGMPLKDALCTTHDLNIQYPNANLLNASLKKPNGYEGNRDFVMKYRLQGGKIESGLLLYPGKDENFFLAMMQPPKRVEPNQIPPREYVFIVDVSGSMYGFPIETSKVLLKNLINNLKPTDKFNVVLFAGTSTVMSNYSVAASAENIQKAFTVIDSQKGGGGTELMTALQTAMSLKGAENYSRSFVIVSDGYISVEKQAFDYIRNNLGRANFFSFGIGSSVNRHLMEGIAHVGYGEALIVLNESEAAEKAEKFRKYISSPVLTNIKIQYDGFDVYDVEPVSVPDVLAERPVLVYGKYRGTPKGKIVLTGTSGAGNYSQTINVASSNASIDNIALKYLWARERIRMISDYQLVDAYNGEYKKEVTAIGLKYSILTEHTSFLAVDSEIRNQDSLYLVNQPLPMPEGVSDYAVGGNMGIVGYSKSSTRLSSGKKRYASVNSAPSFGSAYLSEDEAIPIVESLDLETEKEEEVYIIVEKMPEFLYDSIDLQHFMQANVVIPTAKDEKMLKGLVVLEFEVNTKGEVENVKVLRSLSPEHDAEVIRVIKLTSGKWSPGLQGGNPVNVKFTIPFRF